MYFPVKGRAELLSKPSAEDKMRLILNGVSITSHQAPAIYENQADKLIVTLAEGTENFCAHSKREPYSNTSLSLSDTMACAP